MFDDIGDVIDEKYTPKKFSWGKFFKLEKWQEPITVYIPDSDEFMDTSDRIMIYALRISIFIFTVAAVIIYQG